MHDFRRISGRFVTKNIHAAPRFVRDRYNTTLMSEEHFACRGKGCRHELVGVRSRLVVAI